MFRSDYIDENVKLRVVRQDPETGCDVYALTERPIIVCLCGSTRFKKEFEEANQTETLAGKIVLSVGGFVHSSTNSGQIDDDTKRRLDELHLEKIRLADEVLILNVGGYIGDSTRRELEFAKKHGKIIRSLEPLA